jgi:hypothetical protein
MREEQWAVESSGEWDVRDHKTCQKYFYACPHTNLLVGTFMKVLWEHHKTFLTLTNTKNSPANQTDDQNMSLVLIHEFQSSHQNIKIRNHKNPSQQVSEAWYFVIHCFD